MLYDPKWEVPVVAKPSISDFIAWLETKDPNETYDYTSASNCAYVQYAKSRGFVGSSFHCGPSGVPKEFRPVVHPFWGAGPFRETWRRLTRRSYEYCRGWTFGDALRRARRAM